MRILTAVRQEGVEYIVTLDDEPAALLRPLTPGESQQYHKIEIEESIAEQKSLAQKVANAWTSEKSGVELVSEQRR